jgi:3-deoxy-manno-octulosonate cytidylyltransferase (CMP-KDO synthetase)
MNYDAIGFIPARFASTRLPGKPLIDLCGKPMLQRVWESVSKCRTLRRIVIATDDERIADLCMDIGAEFVYSPGTIPSGTDRIIYAYNMLEEYSDFIVNIQGDEPLLTADIIDKLVIDFSDTPYDVGTLYKRIDSIEDLMNPSVVKLMLNYDHTAKDFIRKITEIHENNAIDFLHSNLFLKHIGIYAYKLDSLQRFSDLGESYREKSEKLEQLRLLDDGASYYCVETDLDLVGVDTPEDVNRVCELLTKYRF